MHLENRELQTLSQKGRWFLCYAYMSQGGASDFVTEDTEVISVTVNDLEGQLFLEKDWENTRSTLTWIDAERNLQFTLMAALNETDILHIAESVSLTELPKQNQF